MDTNGQYGGYNIDICLCIDKTGSMSPIMDTVKKNALNLHRDIKKALEEKQKMVNNLRIRVIFFGDYIADSKPMLLSDFYSMPGQVEQFERMVNSVKAEGGGDAPEDGLEALAYAMRSPWCTDGWKRRHVIALFTDAPAHDMGYGKTSDRYPKADMPADFGELTEMWGDEETPGEMDFHTKRLLLFAPDTSYWHTIANCWENVIMRPAEQATGLAEVTYEAMMNSIANSI